MDKVLAELDKALAELPSGLRLHIYRVRDEAVSMAARFQADVSQVEQASLAHDIARAYGEEELLTAAREWDIPIGPVEQRIPLLLHGPVGMEIARHRLGIREEAVLKAIRWHSTGCQGLGLVGQIVFLADKLEPQKVRRRPFLARVHQLADGDLHSAILEFLREEMVDRLRKGDLIHPASLEMWNWLRMEMAKEH